jgi:thermostable 8-oxoguanine DNA glycosylase
MITAAQIAPYRRTGADYGPTERLKAEMARSRLERHPLYLTKDQFDRILRWKLGQQYGRQRHRHESNTEEIIRMVTGFALTMSLPKDKEYELELRVSVLCSLRGVEVPAASAILALVFPEEYAVIDFRVWRQVFGEDKWTFTINDYKEYVQELRPLAEDLGWPVQEVDHAIWAYDCHLQRMGYKTGFD